MWTYQQNGHWAGRQAEDGVVWLTLDRNDSSANTLNEPVIRELNQILDELKGQVRPKGLVIQSGKKNGFIAGADISQFTQFSTSEEAIELIREGQLVLDKLASLPCPTIALINGFCLGGGYEVALACDYRIADADSNPKLGLPEVMLGIQPGWGGTIRLPLLIGSIKALELIASGRIVSGKQAAKLGMIDQLVPKRHLLAAVAHYLQEKPPKIRAKGWHNLLLLDLVRPFIGKFFSRQISKRVNAAHYPAPFSVIENWVEYDIRKPEAYIAEVNAIGKLLVTDTAQNLVRVFFLREKLKELAKQTNTEVKHVHVIGAGVMGGDIAAWCALRGFQVTLQDTNIQAIASTFKRSGKLFKRKLKDRIKIQTAKDRLKPDPTGLGVHIADVIIEAIIENPEAKQALFKQLEINAKPDAILATNTSTIPLDVIGKDMQRPDRVVGIHFFNPVAKMPLVEVVATPNTDQKIVANAMSFVGKIDKLPLPVKSAPGFLVNRVLMPYLIESAALLEEGIPGQMIDKAAMSFGMPMGPIELADTVGLDVCVAAATSLGEKVPNKIQEFVNKGYLGKKTGQGFYKYKNGKRIKSGSESASVPADITDRLVMRMINEAMACLREGIVGDEELLDAGMIFGTGFAPFLGGPMHYVQTVQRDNVKSRLDQLAQRYGSRFSADEGWVAT